MALPSSYSAILSDLNRDVLRAQPTDALQFCSNWFLVRLEAERRETRGSPHDVPMTDRTPPHSARALPGGQNKMDQSTLPSAAAAAVAAAATASSAFKRGSEPSLVGQGYTFGGSRGMDLDTDNKPSPYSEIPSQLNAGPPPSPFTRRSDHAAISAGGGGGIGTSSNLVHESDEQSEPDAEAGLGAARAAARASGSNQIGGGGGQQNLQRSSIASQDSEDEEEVDDPRDDPDYRPSGQSGGTSGQIPANYNLGRRTSVSAESLQPTTGQALPKTVIPKSLHQRERIEASISNNLLFRNLDEDQHTDVLNAMKEVSVAKGTEVIVQGAVGDFFYVVEEGTFEVWVRGPPTHTYAGPGQSTSVPGEEKKVATYGPGGSFGELALMYNAPRAATVVATSRATMWALDRVTFRSILMEHTSRKRKMYENFLAEVPILASLNTKERAKIADALEEKVYEEGDAVVVEGEVGKNFYIIESGKAEVVKRRKTAGNGSDEQILGNLAKGDYFGELALLNSAPRAATVRAMHGEGRLRVATLGEKAFTRLLGPVIDILQRKAARTYGTNGNSNNKQRDSTSHSGQRDSQQQIPEHRDSFESDLHRTSNGMVAVRGA